MTTTPDVVLAAMPRWDFLSAEYIAEQLGLDTAAVSAVAEGLKADGQADSTEWNGTTYYRRTT